MASAEASKVLEIARVQIHMEKMAAMTEVKNQVAQLAVEMSERILRAELSDAKAQAAMVDRALEDVKLN
jgi:F-type H+-transporting ATPase subunit b